MALAVQRLSPTSSLVMLILVATILFLSAGFAAGATVETKSFDLSMKACVASRLHEPRSQKELVRLVKQYAARAAAGENVTIRVSRPTFHSNNRMPCPDPPRAGARAVQIYLTTLNKVFGVDHSKYQVRVGAGMLLGDLLTLLDSVNMSMPAMSVPIWTKIALGGVIGGDAHGTSLSGPSAFAESVVNATWVDGLGRVHRGTDMNTLAGAMGLTGIITELTVQAQPQIRIKVEWSQKSGNKQFLKDLKEVVAKKEQVQFGWQGDWNRYYTNKIETVPVNTPSNNAQCSLWKIPPQLLSQAASIKPLMTADKADINNTRGVNANKLLLSQLLPKWSKDSTLTPTANNTFIGEANQMMAGDCGTTPCLFDVLSCTLREFSISTKKVQQFLADVTKMYTKFKGYRSLFGEYYFRFSRPTSFLLGTSYGLETAHIDMTTCTSPDLPDLLEKYQDFEEEVEQLALCKYRARPHWGKSTARMLTSECPLRDAYPKFPDFLQLRAKADPYNLFVPALFQRIMDGSGPEYYPGCAVDKACYCKDDSHCNKGNKLYRCLPGATFKEYRVCRV